MIKLPARGAAPLSSLSLSLYQRCVLLVGADKDGLAVERIQLYMISQTFLDVVGLYLDYQTGKRLLKGHRIDEKRRVARKRS